MTNYRRMVMRITFPRVYAIHRKLLKNPIRQLFAREGTVEGSCNALANDDIVSRVFTPEGGGDPIFLRVGTPRVNPAHPIAISCPVGLGGDAIDLSEERWISHPGIRTQEEIEDFPSIERAVLESWKNAFHFSSSDDDDRTIALRKPQLGAIHAAQAHWSTSSAPATIVMPTGTGKTDTMLSLLVLQRFKKVMVAVPTDALRHQIFEKFLTLGILKDEKSTILPKRPGFL